MTNAKWIKNDRGFYSLQGTRYAVMADGYQPIAERDREGDGVLAGITGSEWAVIRYAEGAEHDAQGGENMDWFPTMREARADAEDRARFDANWDAAGKRVATCQWFALCDHQATGTMSHPILGEVPICDRCRAKVEALR